MSGWGLAGDGPLTCADCGKRMHRTVKSKPQGEARCHPCRGLRPGRQPGRKQCFACDLPRKKSGRTCGAPACVSASRSEASQRAAANFFVGRPCQGGCGLTLGRSAPRYCEGCRAITGSTHIACAVLITDCVQCSAPIITRPGWKVRRYCGDADCNYQRWKPQLLEAAHRRRAQMLEQYVEDVSIDYLILRDKGRCHLCGIKVKLDGKRSPLMPSIDHVVPISKGGEHSLANTRLSHYRCNLSKGNRGGGEQLALVG